MKDTKQAGTKGQPPKQSNKSSFIVIGVIVVLVLGLFAYKAFSGGGKSTSSASSGDDLVIPKSEVTETARFYPYKAGKTAMEVIAVKAKDGTIRTALNTCQVCYDSGRGYYVQKGDALVCQNCGNVFKMDQVEKVKGGCNPVPIMKENKTEDGTNITISKDFMEKNKYLFNKWKRQ